MFDLKLFLRVSLFLITGVSFLVFSGCKKDDPVQENEEELITTLSLVLTPDGGGTPAAFVFRDLDGDGGNTPIITADKLAANTTYTGEISLLNEAANPSEDIAAEVKAESLEHQFFFATTTGLNISFAYNDQDDNGNPLGLSIKLLTGDTSTGALRVTLRHEPDKDASGVANGDLTNAGGETDIEVDFTVEIE
ncbi:MAG: hypothetical protein DHS20C18_00430 [Saprospiraceae bacterium]|nr:MAG: hypothetical protein DHS20C18_00430 [Saprospiraceae bacterium]